MSGKCELTGVGVLYGNSVSHSQRKTRRRFVPNLRSVKFTSDITTGKYRLSVSARCISSVEKAGGFDAYILKADNDVLYSTARAVKKKNNSDQSSRIVMKSGIHPDYKEFLIKVGSDVFETMSTHLTGEILMDVDFRKHPAWNKDAGNVINQSNKSVSDFNKRYSGHSFGG